MNNYLSRKIIIIFVVLVNMISSKEGNKKVISNIKSNQFILYKNFPSIYIDSRNIEVFIPDQYNGNIHLSVLYMFDGQNIFHGTEGWVKNTYNHGWQVDESLDSLTLNENVESMIIVGIFNTGVKRFSEYMPSKPENLFKKNNINASEWVDRGIEEYGITSDSLLKFIVNELKPFIDKTYRTRPGRENTFISGSSMGGLISAYAICEYPQIFGAAACLSTHWPALNGIFIEYLRENLPDPKKNKFYFDYGTEGLDSNYEYYQVIVDSLLKDRGYMMNNNWITLKFEGHDHKEKFWKSRFHHSLTFLLAK